MRILEILFTLAIIVALAFLRFRREPRWIGILRFIVAMLLVWNAIATWESHARWQRMHDRRLAGDTHAFDYDTGGGAAMMLIGWIPACAVVGGLWTVRSLAGNFRRHEKSAP
jgi:hypothetical protein